MLPAVCAIMPGRNPLPGGSIVPEVYVHAVKGRTFEQKKALVKDITEA
jgi:Tautomerase enzyme